MIDFIHYDLFNEGSISKKIYISYGDGNIANDMLANDFKLTESLCSANSLKLGSCEASCVTFTFYNMQDVPSLVGKNISVYMVVNDDSANQLQIGYYKVESDMPSADRKTRSIKAYDVLYDTLNADFSNWYANMYEDLKATYTLKQFRDAFCAEAGLVQDNVNLVNDAMVIPYSISAQVLTGKTVLNAICEINGVFGHIGRDGKLHYINVKNSQTAQIDNYSQEFDYEDFDCDPIKAIKIANTFDASATIAGDTSKATYEIVGNFLCYNQEQADLNNIANNLLQVVDGITYRPIKSLKTFGNPCIEVGDKIEVNGFFTYVLSRELNGINAMIDTYSAKGTKKPESNINSMQSQIQQVVGKTSKLILTVDGMESEVVEKAVEEIDGILTATEIVSRINQTAEAVSINANRIKLDGAITANETFEIDTNGTMHATAGDIGGFSIRNGIFDGAGISITPAIYEGEDNGDAPTVIRASSMQMQGISNNYGFEIPSNLNISGNGIRSGGEYDNEAFVLDIQPLRKIGRNTNTANLRFNSIYYNGKEGVTETARIDSETGEIKGRQIKTYDGADLNGNVKMKLFASATGTSSSLPSVDISSLKAGTMIQIYIGANVDANQKGWFQVTAEIPSGSSDYLYNVGGYYYNANYCGSLFVNVSKSRVAINDSWSKITGGSGATNRPLKATTTGLYVYVNNL